MLGSALKPHIGYEKAAGIAGRALADGRRPRAAALLLRGVSAEQCDRWVVPVQIGAPVALIIFPDQPQGKSIAALGRRCQTPSSCVPSNGSDLRCVRWVLGQ